MAIPLIKDAEAVNTSRDLQILDGIAVSFIVIWEIYGIIAKLIIFMFPVRGLAQCLN